MWRNKVTTTLTGRDKASNNFLLQQDDFRILQEDWSWILLQDSTKDIWK